MAIAILRVILPPLGLRRSGRAGRRGAGPRMSAATSTVAIACRELFLRYWLLGVAELPQQLSLSSFAVITVQEIAASIHALAAVVSKICKILELAACKTLASFCLSTYPYEKSPHSSSTSPKRAVARAAPLNGMSTPTSKSWSFAQHVVRTVKPPYLNSMGSLTQRACVNEG